MDVQQPIPPAFPPASMMQPQPPAFLPPPPSNDTPAVVTIFGIMHLIFAGVGILFALYGVLVFFAGDPMDRFMMGGGPEMKAQMEIQAAMTEKIGPMTLATSIVSLLVSIPMIVAGIKLLRRRHDAIIWSNVYAISSLGAKLLNFILSITIMIPAMNEMMEQTMRASATGPGIPTGVSSVISNVMVGTMLVTVLATCIYPALALYFLNRPAPRAWFAKFKKTPESATS